MAEQWKKIIPVLKVTADCTNSSKRRRSGQVEEDSHSCGGVHSCSTTMVGSHTLTVFQKQLLQQTWQRLNKSGAGGIGAVIYQKLLSKRPELRPMFQKASVVSGFSGSSNSMDALGDHTRFITELLDRTVNSLDDLSDLAAECSELGRLHAHLDGDFNVEYWDKLGQAALEAFTQLETVRKHRELVKAWMILISFIIDNIRCGYLSKLKQLQADIDKP